ncbi:MAG TPA: amidohydrolase family protein [bacterium]|nr:amidohydrolase family protein [bacterium]
MYDLVIRGGTVVDGTGAPARKADVAIGGGRIAAVGEVADRGREELDAAGQVVAPGFIDVHTHYDAQYTWDPYATCSIWHGVTTTVIGNCGFAIAPCRPEHRETTLRTLTRVEGMSLKAMQAGINWGFETFPQYLDYLADTRPALNIAALLGHSSLRTYVMGPDAQQREATPAEVAEMARLTREAMQAGAIGLGSSTAEAHNGDGGLPVPSRLASFDELRTLVAAMGEGERGLFEITVGQATGMEDLAELHRASGRPVIWAAFFVREDKPEYMRDRLAATERFARDGVPVIPQVSCRPLTMDFTLANPYPFEGFPCWKAVARRPAEEWPQVYADAAFRDALRDDIAHQRFSVFRGRWDLVQVLQSPSRPDLQGQTVTQLAAATGQDEVDAFFSLGLADGLRTEFVAGLMNTDAEKVGELISHPDTLIALSDAGAHLSLLCDAGYSTHLLGHWVREQHRLSLEDAVHRLTAVPAQVYRIPQRGVLQEGYWADVVVFDPDRVAAEPPEWAHDLPGGEPRFVSRARGVSHSLVNGVPVVAHGEVLERPAAERPGQVLREFLT